MKKIKINQQIQSYFWARKGIFFCLSVQAGKLCFATFNTSWLPCSRLLMAPGILVQFLSSWTPPLLPLTLLAGSPMTLCRKKHFQQAGSSGWRMPAGCRTRSNSSPEVLRLFRSQLNSISKRVLFVEICLRVALKTQENSLFQNEKCP